MMKNVFFKLTAISSLLFSASSLASGLGAEIKLTGDLIAPKCTINTPDMVFDYGDKISPTLISNTAPVSLGPVPSVSLTVNCDAQTTLTFGVTDNRLGTASMSGSKYFGLGNINGTGKLGHYLINVSRPTVDQQAAATFVSSGSTIQQLLYTAQLEHGKRSGWAKNGERSLAIGKTFGLDVSTEAFLAKRGDMHGGVGDDTALDGSATLEFGFGL
jgi:type 1 fimbria pilin